MLTVVVDDGLRFDPLTIQAERIRKNQQYKGVRVSLMAYLGNARIVLNVYIGYGDAVTPEPSKQNVPCLLDFDAPNLFVYP